MEEYLEVTLFHGSFSRFENSTNGTKSRKALHIDYRKLSFFNKHV